MSGEHFGAAVVRDTRDVARDVRLIEIVPEAGVRPYPSGSHLDLTVTVQGLPDVRSYSLVGTKPAAGAYRIAVKAVADSRGGSRFMHGLRPGDALAASEPRSHFELAHGRPDYLLVAGGIGITPIVGMAAELVRAGAGFRLLYAGHSRDQMPFVDELAELAGDRLELFVSDQGRRLDLGAEVDRLDPDGELYLCGPVGLRELAMACWRERQRPPARLRFETFASGGRFAPERFTVRVSEHAGREVAVGPNRTMLDALRDAGVDMMWDCLRGECGLCTVSVLEAEGELDHRDVFLSDQERDDGDRLVTCVSRAVGGRVTVDTGFRPDPGRV